LELKRRKWKKTRRKKDSKPMNEENDVGYHCVTSLGNWETCMTIVLARILWIFDCSRFTVYEKDTICPFTNR
jgi:hypothetical protein